MLFGLRKGIVSIYHHVKITPGGNRREEAQAAGSALCWAELLTPGMDLASW